MASDSTAPPRTKPEMSRPFENRSINASSSARRTGLPFSGRMLPAMKIFTRSVTFASTVANRLGAGDMAAGAL